MEDIKIEFTPEDISNVLFEWYKLSQNDETVKEIFLKKYLDHNLTSAIFSILNLSNLFEQNNLSTQSDDVKNKFKLVEKQLNNIERLYASIYDDIKQGNLSKKYFFEFANQIHNKYKLFHNQCSIFSLIKSSTKLNDYHTSILNRAQFGTFELIYIANKFFKKKIQNNSYHLKEDLNFFKNKIQNIFDQLKINAKFNYQLENEFSLITLEDYLSNVIEPLTFNSIQHGLKDDKYLEITIRTTFQFKKYERKKILKLPETGLIEIKYSDNGCGIDPKHLPYVFDKGFTTKKEKQGHGIGLWGVKQFVEKNGGTISLESTLGEGTTFQFTIPYEKIDNLYLRQRRV